MEKQKISSVYTAKPHITVNNKKNCVLHKNASMANLYRQQQYNALTCSYKAPNTFLSDFKSIYPAIFGKKKLHNTKFHGNPSSDIRADTCGRTDGNAANWLFWRLRQRACKQ